MVETDLSNTIKNAFRDLKKVSSESERLQVNWGNILKQVEKVAKITPQWLTGVTTTSGKMHTSMLHFFNLLESKHPATMKGLKAMEDAWFGAKAAAGLFLLGRGLKWMHQIGAAMIEMTANTDRRHDILKETAKVQVRLGSSTTETTDAMKAMVRHGLDLRKNFGDNLKLIVMMNEGLGLSVELGAELAFIYGDRLKASFHGIANVLTQIVTQTALSADEAGRFAIELGKAALFLQEGSRGGLAAGALQMFEEIEATVKQAGAVPGELTKMFSNMATSLDSSMTAMVLGQTSTSALTQQGGQAIVDRINALLRPAAGARDQGDDIGYKAQLETVRSILGDALSTQTLNAMVNAQRESTLAKDAALTIEQKWAQQVRDSGQVWSKLSTSFFALVHEGALPLLETVRGFFGWIQYLLDKLRESPRVLSVVTTSITGIAAVAIPLVLRSILQLGAALTMLARVLQTTAVRAGALSSIGGIGGAPSLGRSPVDWGGALPKSTSMVATKGLIATWVPIILSGAMAVIGALAIGWLIGTGINWIWDWAHKKSVKEAGVGGSMNARDAANAEFKAGVYALVHDTGKSVRDLKDFTDRWAKKHLASGDITPEQVWTDVADVVKAAEFMLNVKQPQVVLGNLPMAKYDPKVDQQQLEELKKMVELFQKEILEKSKQRGEDKASRLNQETTRLFKEAEAEQAWSEAYFESF
jgi:hypothetical protein